MNLKVLRFEIATFLLVFGKEEQGLDYYGNDIRNYKVTSKEVCRADCEKDMSCKLWLVLGKKKINKKFILPHIFAFHWKISIVTYMKTSKLFEPDPIEELSP